ncbi:MAG: L,D-transpeptidase [Pseudorhodoplanes sp.]|jgi:lipoprotein-anchoring transpeptidase ErfK/SrfK|nr:L,D-transpeptidase [Pseudorhodoplanes sp.]
MHGISTFFIAALALIGLSISPLSAQTLAAATASGEADAAAGVTSSETTPGAVEVAQKPKARSRRQTAQPAPQPTPAKRFTNFFLGNNASTSARGVSASARPGAQGGSTAEIMMQRAVASYSTSSNALGFGLYRIVPKETVDFREKHAPGTIIVRQREKRLYYVLGDGKAIKYAIAVGREGAAWSGVSTVSDKREWPDWTPTPDILKRQPDLPRHVEGGPHNPLGARALYLGQTLYRIHGTNEPWRIGEEASSGCIRMTNNDIIDLYNRTKIGATVIVQR